MRLKQLSLIKYGKFDSTPLDFPRGETDFHVIVGPNEAGKSTIRNAISELLFGMPLRTNMNFKHPLPDLRLGGILENDADGITFHRTRGRQSLRTSADKPLPDSALLEFLGAVDKSFFEQMYGLDHSRLVNGGQSILDGSKDVGQVLFQSAAGIAGLGRIRENLEQKAASVWRPRASNCSFAQAAQRLEDANTELKSAQVKTKAWSDANTELNGVLNAIQGEEAKLSTLESARSKLERVRRLAPFLLKLREKQAELANLGEVASFPPNAHEELISCEAELSAAQAQLDARTESFAVRTAEREAISYNAALLDFKHDIEELESLRNQCKNHRRDMQIQQGEVDRCLAEVKGFCNELGWPQDEQPLRIILSTPLALRAVSKLLRDEGALRQAKRNSNDAVHKKGREVDSLETDIEKILIDEVPAELRCTLLEAQTYKNSLEKQRTLSVDVVQAKQQLSNYLTALVPWQKSVEQLRTMALPSNERVSVFKKERQEFQSGVRATQERLNDADMATAKFELDVKHFVQTHNVVTTMEVREARSKRDLSWQTLKSGEITLAAGASALDVAIQLADELVDLQLGSATEAANLQNLRQQIETSLAEAKRLSNTLLDRKQELADHEAQWDRLSIDCGLPGVHLDDFDGWVRKREEALSADDALSAKQRELDTEVAVYRNVKEALQRTLQSNAIPFSATDDLPALCAVVEEYLSQADASLQRKAILEQQHRQGLVALADLKATATTADNDYKEWEVRWADAIKRARLETASGTMEQAEMSVDLATKIAEIIEKVDSIRRERIETMRADLDRFEANTRRLSSELDLECQASDFEQTSKKLGELCQAAVAAAQRAELADTALRSARQQKDEGEERVRSAKARLTPLFELAGVTTAAEAFPLIERSETKRRLLSEIDETRNALIDGGDGLTIEAIEVEVLQYSPTEIPALFEETKRDLSEVNDRLNTLLQNKVRAEQVFSAIAGQAYAAVAEAKRQEVLADMSNASEEYLETATASKLLKWAIDRYRDKKQGPMLQRASAVFSNLILGDFSKLGVDFEKAPPVLYAQRKNGSIVEVAGLSEGTRDQLYLALRIAALELHLDQSKALPFIADDLFINFDDERAKAGLEVLRDLSQKTQVVFLTHHNHLVPIIAEVFGRGVNVVTLHREFTADQTS